jgi:hypothetical protein
LTLRNFFVILISVLGINRRRPINRKRPAKTLFLAHALTLIALGLIVTLAF